MGIEGKVADLRRLRLAAAIIELRGIIELLDQEGCGVAACRLDHALVSVESEMEASGPSAPKAARLH